MRVIDLSTLSLVGGSGIAEAKIPLWWADGTSNGLTTTTWVFVIDGSSGYNASISSGTEIFTLSSAWNPSLRFALETTSSTTSGLTIYMTLWDMTANTQITSSQISNTSTSETIMRSGAFTLTPGHQYGVAVKMSGANNGYISDASLIIFP